VSAPTPRSPAKGLGPRASRTVARIIESTRTIFLSRGFAGTTVDEIARVAGISRASFYTYFRAKRDVLLVLGAEAARAGDRVIDRVRATPREWTRDDLGAFVDEHFRVLDEHGSFVFAWTQAAHEDDEIRRPAMKRHLEMCRELGLAIGPLRGRPFGSPTARGLVIFAMIERAWSYRRLYADTIDSARLRRELVGVMESMLRDVGPREETSSSV
jgi:AcrR family transcriptional regulator